MFIAILKKELLQFVRSKSSMLMMFIFPIVLITVIGAGMENFMSGDVNIFDNKSEENIIYYSSDNESNINEGFNVFKERFSNELSIEFIQVSNLQEVKENVDNYKGIAFIEIKGDKIAYYGSAKGESSKSKIIKSIFQQFIDEYKVIGVAAKINPVEIQGIINKDRLQYAFEEGLDGVKDINAYEYFTFAELALILVFLASTVGYSVYKENESGTINRIRLSKASELTNIASKIIFGIIVGIGQILAVYLYSTFVLKVNWGDRTLAMMSIFVCFTVFSSSLGVVIGLLVTKPTSIDGIIGIFGLIINALGGSYCPIFMLTSIPIISDLMKISPIYWINVAVSSLNCGLDNNAPMISITISLSLAALCITSYFVIRKNRRLGDV